MAAYKQREGSHQVLVIWTNLPLRKEGQELHVIISIGDDPLDAEKIAFQQFLYAVKRLRDLTRMKYTTNGT